MFGIGVHYGIGGKKNNAKIIGPNGGISGKKTKFSEQILNPLYFS